MLPHTQRLTAESADGRSRDVIGGYVLPPQWHGRPYYSLDAWCKNTFGRKLYKTALDAGCTCPNRDGSIAAGGCIFCSAGGSGDFAAPFVSVRQQIDWGVALLSGKWRAAARTEHPDLIAYFQSYTNTYGDPGRLSALFKDALLDERVAGISIATRPDCLSPAILQKLDELKLMFPGKFIWIELGLQTIHDRTADMLRRGYPSSVFYEAMHRLARHRIPVIVHIILGLPGESREDLMSTIRAVNAQQPFGIKLQLLHVLKNTELARLYEKNAISVLTKEEYLELVTDCIGALSPEICIHRLTGDGPRELMIAPEWSLRKKDVLNGIHAAMKRKGIRQGLYYESGTTDSL